MKALIIGGGIAGAATAIALAKAGIASEVFEARDAASDGTSAYVTLAVNGVAALRLIGVDLRDVDNGIPTPNMELLLGNGRSLARFPLGPRLADGTTSRTIMRSSLYVALRKAAAHEGAQLHYGRRLQSASLVNGQVVARFEDGSVASGDLLIGADGLHSVTRRIIDPSAPAARSLGLLNTGGVATGVSVDSEPGTMMMVFGRKAFFSYLARDNGEVWWFANPPHRGEPTRAELADIPWRTELEALFTGDNSPAVDLIRATPDIITPWGTYDFPEVPTWHRDRMIIIGDAAHAASPSSGQGASMAIEDAITLARALRDQPGVDQAFDAYEAARRDRVARIVAQGKASSDDKSHGPLGRIVRDLALRVIFSRPPKNDLDWMYTEFPLVW